MEVTDITCSSCWSCNRLDAVVYVWCEAERELISFNCNKCGHPDNIPALDNLNNLFKYIDKNQSELLKFRQQPRVVHEYRKYKAWTS